MKENKYIISIGVITVFGALLLYAANNSAKKKDKDKK